MDSIGKNSIKEVFGVTGNIASGKSYALDTFKQIAKKENIKISLVQVDEIRREILTSSKDLTFIKLRQTLVEKLNLSLIQNSPYYAISGLELGETIFSSEKKMETYKDIVNPFIRDILTSKINNSKGIIVVEWAMLAEDGWLDLVNGNVVLLKCSESTQSNRLMDTDLPLSQLHKRIKFQLNTKRKTNLIKK